MKPLLRDLLTALGSLILDHPAALWEQNSASPTNALDFVHGKFDHPAEALLGAHYLLRFLPDQLPLAWADKLRDALPEAADGPVVAAWLRITSNANDVHSLEPQELQRQMRRFLTEAQARPITWLARTLRLLVDGLRLEQVKAPRKTATSLPDPAAYLDYGALAGGLEAFWGTHPFSPGPTARCGAPPNRRIVTIALDGATFARVLPDTTQTVTRSARARHVPDATPTEPRPARTHEINKTPKKRDKRLKQARSRPKQTLSACLKMVLHSRWLHD